MEWESLAYHVDSIHNHHRKAVERLVNVGLLHVNRRLSSAYERGLSSAGWKTLLQPFIASIHADHSFRPDGDTAKFLYKLAYPAMREAVRHYYKHGVYPIDGVIEYAAYRQMKAKSIDWYYHAF